MSLTGSPLTHSIDFEARLASRCWSLNQLCHCSPSLRRLSFRSFSEMFDDFSWNGSRRRPRLILSSLVAAPADVNYCRTDRTSESSGRNDAASAADRRERQMSREHLRVARL